ncbi:hypothetical protein [Botrimarina mediterranea]|uniref:hypothetical protein n=1 Tax=Botrimarina mediterranea TaxID=2528022 RepID=UPI00118AF279|nr:hypothetical protein K2D_25740 [Planctomycetes bacterium K2D]
MTTKWRLVACTLVGAAALGVAQRATAIELLTAGDFEVSAGPAIPEVPSWTLLEYVSASPSTPVNSAALLGGVADNPIDPLNINPDHRGLWFRPFVGTTEGATPVGPVDAILSQTVAATPGQTYTFAGDASFETNYLGGMGEPGFRTEFELAFLDSSGAVIGSPIVRDLSLEVINGLGYSGTNGNPEVTPLVGVAPAGSASVRVRAQALNMVRNNENTGQQSSFADNFSLTTSDAPTTELLANPNLNILPPVAPTAEEVLSQYFDFVETPETSTDIVRVATFANNPATGGTNGIWISPFLTSAQGGSGVVSQTVEGMPGTEYTFSAGALFQPAFVGDTSTTDENKVELELAFLDGADVVISSVVLDLRDAGQTAGGGWMTHSLSSTAPAGTVNVKVSGIVSNLTNNTDGGQQSAFWDDFSLMAAVAGLPGDYNGDNVVDAADYTVWRDGNSPDDTQAGYDLWAANYGATSAPSAAAAIPEPTACVLVLFGLTAVAARRRLV